MSKIPSTLFLQDNLDTNHVDLQKKVWRHPHQNDEKKLSYRSPMVVLHNPSCCQLSCAYNLWRLWKAGATSLLGSLSRSGYSSILHSPNWNHSSYNKPGSSWQQYDRCHAIVQLIVFPYWTEQSGQWPINLLDALRNIK